MIKTADQQHTIQKVKSDLANLIAKLKDVKKAELQPEQVEFIKILKNHYTVFEPNPTIEKFVCAQKDRDLYFNFIWSIKWLHFYIKSLMRTFDKALEALHSQKAIKFEWGGGQQSLENSVLEYCKSYLRASKYNIESRLEEEYKKDFVGFLEKTRDEKVISISEKYIDFIEKFTGALPEVVRILNVVEKSITSYSLHYVSPKYEKNKVKTKVHKSAKDLRDFFFNQNKQNEDSGLTEKSKKNYGSSQSTDSTQIWANFIANIDFSEFEEDADTLSLIENNNNNRSSS